MRKIALIPARGGSKGLPKKNILELCGKPLIAHTILAAQRANCFTDIIVSTDCPEIAEVSLKYGASVPFLRRQELSTDEASAIDVYIDAIEQLEKNGGEIIESLCVLQPTSPLRVAEDITRSLEIFILNNADSVVSVTECKPKSWICSITDDGKLFAPNLSQVSNRQAEARSFIPNGAVYILKKELLYKRTYYSDKTYAYKMPKSRSVDIDDYMDFQFAELHLK